MDKSLRLFMALCALLAPALRCFAQSQPASPAVSLPLAFEINRGQTVSQVKFLARSREGVLFFTADGVTVAVPHQQGSFRLLFENGAASRDSAIVGEQKMIARSNYLNHEPALTGVENYGALRYASVYPGIDVRFYGQGRHLEHDFVIAAGADPARIVLRAEGLDGLALQPSGEIELSLGRIKLFESAPVAWQTINGKRVPVEAAWKVLSADRLGVSLGAYNHELPLTIDPVLAYATHLGGTMGHDSDGFTFPADTTIRHIALDANRNIYVSGTTSATDFPTTAGAFDRTPSSQGHFHMAATTQSGFVAKFDKTGRILIYSTFFRVDVHAMSVDASGHVYAAEGAFVEDLEPNFGSDSGIVIAKLSLDGSSILYQNIFATTNSSSPQCQVTSNSEVGSIVADNSGHVWMTGRTGNPCMFTTPGAFQTTIPNANSSGYVVEFDTNKTPPSSTVFATFLGGSNGISRGQAIAIDSSANVYIAGATSATNFPHGAGFGSGAMSAFVTKMNPTGSGLIFSTLLHGVDDFTGIGGIGLDTSHNVYVTGSTTQSTFPTTLGAFQRTPAGGSDVFVTKLSPGGGTLVYSTRLGGSGNDVSAGIHLNNARMAFITGSTGSANFPTTANAFRQSLSPATQDAFVTALQPDGKSLVYSTLLGGSKTTTGEDIWVDPAWNAWVAGNTSASDFPVTPNAFQPGLKGESDAFIAKVVIAADLAVLSPSAPATIARGQVLTYHLFIGNNGPDNSDNLIITDTLASGTSFFSSSLSGGIGPASCTTPPSTQNGGTITCHWRGLPAHNTIDVTIKAKVNAAAGSTLVNTFKVTAQTQDLKPGNNSVKFTTVVH